MARKLFFNLLIFSCSLIVTILLAELLLSISYPQNLSGSWRVHTERGLGINRAGGEAHHTQAGRSVTYRFNEYHLRGGEIDPSKELVLVVGDSFTFGWLLNEEDTYVSRLQSLADSELGSGRFQFLNGGVLGWGTSHYLSFIEEFGEKIRPARILVFLNIDDIERSIASGLYTLEDKQELSLRAHVLPPPPRLKRFLNSFPLYNWLLERSHIMQLLRRYYLLLGQKRKGPTRKDVQLVENDQAVPVPRTRVRPERARRAVSLGHALFRRLKEWCVARNIELYVTTTGWHFDQERSDPTAQFMKHASEIFAEEGITFHDITPGFQAEMQDRIQEYYIPGDGHPTEKASEAIARHAWSWFRGELK